MSTPPTAPSRLVLPPVPAHLRAAPVAAWQEPVVIDTYEPLPPDRYPMFLESRVYQGSSGRVYPLAFHERISRDKRPRRWQAVHLENAFVRVMVLPELGGRIHVGYDKSSGYDFFYRNNVIKPALVGLAGPWISGGVELNWPQHHRPATFLPADVVITHDDDGSVTVWCSDHDPFHRMKGMHGITLHPDRSVLELKVRLHNRTEDVRTFLWWANAAARVHEEYQSFFPPDVGVVADHARRATTGFPRATGDYYGIDYPSRVTPEDPDADRIDWYRNIPVPTSYMCVGSHGDFFGGYDHRSRAGFVHWADHRISPGKKQWTWGNAAFGRAWERHLTDGDGPYVELMAGVFTDNQPDFAYLAPGETKAFSQFWYPIQEIGPVQQASVEAALAVDLHEVRPGGPVDSLTLGVAVTRPREELTVEVVSVDGSLLWATTAAAAPGSPLRAEVGLPGSPAPTRLRIVVRARGTQLLQWSPPAGNGPARVEVAREPPAPEEIASVEELYLTGVHLAQYRHATRSPEPYWREALARDAGDSRSAVALARIAHSRGDFTEAEQLLRTAVGRVTRLNGHPRDGEAHYRLGLALHRQDRFHEADECWAAAAWDQAWRAPAHLAMARRRCVDRDWANALLLLDSALAVGADNLAARDLRVLVLRRLGRADEARRQLSSTLELDPLDWWARDLAGHPLTCDARTLLDVGDEYAAAGFLAEALRLAEAAEARAGQEPWRGTHPMASYRRAQLLDRLGRPGDAGGARRAARAADPDYCFPSGLDDERTLRDALAADPGDGRAAALLGHWLYDRRRHRDAMTMWRRAVAVEPGDSVCRRNLAVASFNVTGDADEAFRCFDDAVRAAPDDSRLWFERDQLAKRTGRAPSARAAQLLDRPDLVAERDDLTVELVNLLVQTADPDAGLGLMRDRDFQPWEGGEGLVLQAWERVQLALAAQSLAAGRPGDAEERLRAAIDPPDNLGEAPHPLANRADLFLALGDALAGQGRHAEAVQAWTTSASYQGDFQEMSAQPYSEKTLSSAIALRRLGRDAAADRLLAGLAAYALDLQSTAATIDYFATSLPDMLLFSDDVQARRRTTAAVLLAQVAAGRGDLAEAVSRLEDVLERDPNHGRACDLLHLVRTGGLEVGPVAGTAPVRSEGM
jgi:tetratricopeptide (TPR) repeat protein